MVADPTLRGCIGTQQHLGTLNRAWYIRPRTHRPCPLGRFEIAEAVPEPNDTFNAFSSKPQFQMSPKVAVAFTAHAAKCQTFFEQPKGLRNDVLPRKFFGAGKAAVNASGRVASLSGRLTNGERLDSDFITLG